MEPNEPQQTSPKRLLLILLILVSVGCSVTETLFPAEARAPELFPDGEIVFRAPLHTLGFVNSDGTDVTLLHFVVKDAGDHVTDWWRPVITGDRRTVLVKVIDSYHFISDRQPLAVWTSGEFPVFCSQWPAQQFPALSPDQRHAFVQSDQSIAMVELSDCGLGDAAPVSVYEGSSGLFSPDMQSIARVSRSADPDADRFVIVRDTLTGEERTVGIGDYPAWSRDSQWLAYTGTDGIYVANVVEGTEPRRAVAYLNPFEEENPTFATGDYDEVPPEVSWSPDGRWLVYHRWLGTDESTAIDPGSNAIFTLDLETGVETLIVNGGMYPSWRWPISSP